MQHLHRDPPARVMDTVGDHPVIGDITLRKQPRRARKHPAFKVGRHAPRHHQRDTAPRPLGIEFGHPVPVAGLFKPGMHRPHQNPVGQGHMAQIKRSQKMRIRGHVRASLPTR